MTLKRLLTICFWSAFAIGFAFKPFTAPHSFERAMLVAVVGFILFGVPPLWWWSYDVRRTLHMKYPRYFRDPGSRESGL